MIQEIVDRFMENKKDIREEISKKHPKYIDLVRIVAKYVKGSHRDEIDINSLQELSSGGYSGTNVYVMSSGAYGSTWWYVRVFYGSCSGCDTLKRIRTYDDDPPAENQIDDYMTVALHIAQGFRVMDGGLE